MQVTAVLIAAGNKLLLKIHGNKSTSKEVIHIPLYRSEVIYGGTWFSSSRKFVPSFVFAIYTRFTSLASLRLHLPFIYSTKNASYLSFFFLTYRARLIFIMSLKSNISLKSLKSKTLLRSLWAKRRIQLEPNNLLHFWIHFIFQFHQLPNFISQRYVKRLSFLFCFVSWMSFFPPLFISTESASTPPISKSVTVTKKIPPIR
ncbi:hypothetical protein ES332_D04G059700v1 [Gossypium tomentosum]|uniref:Uncharacterized protein n=1 Tax=Gossypium tomentosum TaxID=34277 RepID=A0A5D2L9Z4_GOSTO|nr:hypothetical protein ES332_D04G059700v1 [Gossypium tomentosum]